MNAILRSLLIGLMFSAMGVGIIAAAEAPLDQVVIEGKRADLVKLAQQIQLAEQRFYQRYNEINTKRAYAVRCYNEAPTGSRFKQKYCKPVYESEAEATEGREFILALGRGASAGSTSGGASASAGVMGAGSNVAGMPLPTVSPNGAFGTPNGNPPPAGGAPPTGFSTGSQANSGVGAAPPRPGGGTVASFIEIEAERPGFKDNLREVASKSPDLIKLLQEHDALVKRYQELYQKLNESTPQSADAPTGTPATERN